MAKGFVHTEGFHIKTNAEYHQNKTHLTSSSLKLLLKSPAEFYDQWANNAPKEEKDVFQEGSLTHSLALEPHLVPVQYAFYPGLRRVGAAFEQFRDENPGKAVLTTAQKLRAESYVRAMHKNETALSLLVGGEAELSLTSTIAGVDVKCRADYINWDKSYIVDIKTSGWPAEVDVFRQVLNDYKYDLSAALYCQIAEQRYGKSFDFYFIVISKVDKVCNVFKLSAATRALGAAQVMTALSRYKKCKESGLWLDEVPATEYNLEIEEV